jgi:type IV pilus assembly protein PilM
VARLGQTAEGGGKPPKAAKATAGPRAPIKRKPTGGTFVGVDIGSQQIKVIEVRGAGPALTVTGLGIMNTPPGAVINGLIADPKALGAAIKQLMQKSGVRPGKTVSSVAGADGVVVRVIEMPAMTPAELKEAIKWEVERSIPFPINDVEMDYQALEFPTVTDPAAPPNMEVLFAAARRDMVSAHLDTLTAAGLNPSIVDIEPLAVGRSLIDLSKRGLIGKNVVIVNIGAALTEVCVFKGGMLRFPRTIPIAGDSFTRAISDQLGIPMDAAEDEKRQNGMVLMELLGGGATFGDAAAPAAGSPFDFDFGEETTVTQPPVAAPADPDDPFAAASTFNPFDAADGGAGTPPGTPPPTAPAPVPDDPRSRRRREIFDALLPVLGEFAMEVRRSVDYFRSRYPNDTVDNVLLCGGSARLGNLDKYLEYELGIPAEVADPFANVTVAAKQMSLDKRNESAPAFAVALGLAARDAVLGPDK